MSTDTEAPRREHRPIADELRSWAGWWRLRPAGRWRQAVYGDTRDQAYRRLVEETGGSLDVELMILPLGKVPNQRRSNGRRGRSIH